MHSLNLQAGAAGAGKPNAGAYRGAAHGMRAAAAACAPPVPPSSHCNPTWNRAGNPTGATFHPSPLPEQLCSGPSPCRSGTSFTCSCTLALILFPVQYNSLLHAAAKCQDPVDRLRHVVAFAVSGLCRQVSFHKPFNPILGETYQVGCRAGQGWDGNPRRKGQR